MPAEIRVAAMRQAIKPVPEDLVVNTCSNSLESWSSDFSPFILGPCDLYGGHKAIRHECAWQFSKLYAVHATPDGEPTDKYWAWAKAGWASEKAIRFPMGRGARPLHCWWDGKKLGYVDSRKQIYGPLYRDLVTKTKGYAHLQELMQKRTGIIWLRDFDGYDEVAKGMTLTDVLNCSTRKAGHSFFLKMLITNDPALKQLAQR